jgi:hypothetical protein
MALDRRNSYRENAKASRKGIPLSKARSHRKLRRSVVQALHEATLVRTDEVEANARSTSKQKKVGAFKKSPDQPLAAHIKQQGRQRAERGV